MTDWGKWPELTLQQAADRAVMHITVVGARPPETHHVNFDGDTDLYEAAVKMLTRCGWVDEEVSRKPVELNVSVFARKRGKWSIREALQAAGMAVDEALRATEKDRATFNKRCIDKAHKKAGKDLPGKAGY